MLNREYYINELEYYTNDWRIKMVVGMRGSGKTAIFQQLMKKLKQDEKADNDHIIYINFEYFEFEKLRDTKYLKEYVLEKIKDVKRYYLFLDEIHHVTHFEALLRYFWMYASNISMYVSTSNSRLLPPDLARFLKYNYLSFYVTPFTYSETCELLHTDIKDKKMLLNYLTYGGFPGRFHFKKSTEVKDYIYSLLESSYLRDVVMRLGIREIDDLNCVFRYVLKYLGKTFSDYLVKDEVAKENIHPEYFYTYLDSLSKALIIRPSYGYSVRSNKILYGVFRYYIADFGLAYINGFEVKNNMEGALKNLVWLELKRKGYEVYCGTKDGEDAIDMVAVHEERIMYIQVVHLFEDGSEINKQIAKFDDFEALGPKYLLSLDKRTFARNGVIHKNIIDFLLDKSIEIEKEEKNEIS